MLALKIKSIKWPLEQVLSGNSNFFDFFLDSTTEQQNGGMEEAT